MYPTLTHLIEDIFGVYIPLPIQTYGFFVALAYLTGAYFISLELKRKEIIGKFSTIEKKVVIGKPASNKEMIISGIVGFILGFKLLYAFMNYSAFVANPQEMILSGDGSFVGGLLIAAGSVFYTYRDKKKKQLPKPKVETQFFHPYELTGNILVVAAIFGLLGAKLFHLLENIDELIANPIESIISFSGLTFFGGLIVGGSALIYYANKNNIKPLHMLDSGSPAIALAYGIGRIGCQMSGDGCWGVPNPNPKPEWLSFLPDWMWAFKFPNNVIKADKEVIIPSCTGDYCHQLAEAVYPTSFYETLMMVTIFAILWSIRKQIKIPGLLFSIFLVFQGIERFFIEKIRVNNVYNIFSADITQAEIIATVLFLLGITGIILTLKKKEKLADY